MPEVSERLVGRVGDLEASGGDEDALCDEDGEERVVECRSAVAERARERQGRDRAGAERRYALMLQRETRIIRRPDQQGSPHVSGKAAHWPQRDLGCRLLVCGA